MTAASRFAKPDHDSYSHFFLDVVVFSLSFPLRPDKHEPNHQDDLPTTFLSLALFESRRQYLQKSTLLGNKTNSEKEGSVRRCSRCSFQFWWQNKVESFLSQCSYILKSCSRPEFIVQMKMSSASTNRSQVYIGL